MPDGIVSTNGSLQGTFNLGGVFGLISYGGPITNTTYSGGLVRGYSAGMLSLGGFIGDVYNCSFTGCSVITANGVTGYVNNASSYTLAIGGFAGTMRNSSATNCYTGNPVTVPQYNLCTGNLGAGGFCGMLWMDDTTTKLESCYATGNIDVVSRSNYYYTYPAYIGDHTGGLVGIAFSESGPKAVITKCYALGNVKVTSHASYSGTPVADALPVFCTAGGLVGTAHSTQISECYAKGDVTATKAAGTVAVTAGGLVGYLGWFNDNAS